MTFVAECEVICTQKRDRLFQLCSDCPEARTYGGISLGLYLCHQIIRSHGGSIGVDSALGEGTTIWFTLPSKMLA